MPEGLSGLSGLQLKTQDCAELRVGFIYRKISGSYSHYLQLWSQRRGECGEKGLGTGGGVGKGFAPNQRNGIWV